jgi:uncharacterized repeat protein (TIGR01451 family)
MKRKKASSVNVLAIGGEVLLVCFLLWVVSQALTNSFDQVTEAKTAVAAPLSGQEKDNAILPTQGTTLVAVIEGAIETSDQSFTGQRHNRTSIPGDRRCAPFGAFGKRYYDEVVFLNTSPSPQKVTIGLVSSCGNNVYMAAYNQQFTPRSLCANFLAQPGRSGNFVWEFTVCGNSQFSIVVYGVEPNLLCKRYSYSVYGVGIKLLSPTLALRSEGAPSPELEESPPLPEYDVEIRKKKPKEDRDTRRKIVLPEDYFSGSLIADQGTPIAAIVSDSITSSDRFFNGTRHSRSGIPGDPNCVQTGAFSTRRYDEVIFVNTSPLPQRVTVQFRSFCGFSTYAAAYSPRFTPTDICAGYLAGAGASGNSNWQFTVCGNSQFSIVVYAVEFFVSCSGYSYTVFGEGIAPSANLGVLKVATSGSASLGSNINYQIFVSNLSPYAVGNITLKDNLPAGTTFVSLNLLSDFGTLLPTPSCVTPPVGQPGMVICTLNTLGGQGTTLPNVATFSLTTKLVSANASQISNTAVVSHLGPELAPATNTSTAVVSLNNPFDICLQDESNGNFLKFNSATGQYEFKACASGVTLAGTGTLTIRGNTITLQQVTQDRRIQVQVDTGTKKANATIQALALGANFSITDSNILNNTCACTR